MSSVVTVQELFDFSLEMDFVNLSHSIFWALSNGHVTTACNADKLQAVEYDKQAIDAMARGNLLSIGKIKLFVVQSQQQSLYAFYYAENPLEVYSMHQQAFREKPKKVTLANHLLKEYFEFVGSESQIMLSEHRKKVVAFPYYLGHAHAGARILESYGVVS